MPDVARSASGRTVDSWEMLYRTAGEGEPLSGYYHRNYRVGLPPRSPNRFRWRPVRR